MSALHTSGAGARSSARAGVSPSGSRGGSSADLLVFSDDWGRHPSSCQHLVRALLPRHEVCWVNTIGTRTPKLDRLTAQRAWGKLGRWTRAVPPAGPPAAPHPRILEPIMWPTYRSTLGRSLNRELVTRAVEKALARSTTRGASTVAVTTVPLVADLVGRLAVDRWVYYCVDDLSSWPGLDASSLRDMERSLVRDADAIIAVSAVLVERMAAMGRRATLLTHGVDIAHWRSGAPVHVPSIARLEPPLIVFWGVIDRRLSLEWLRRLDQGLDRGTIVLVGPENNPDPALLELSRVARTGALGYDELPAVAAAASVLIMPYADMPATRAIQPLKLKEYLVTGKPVVASRLPALADWGDACDVVDSAERFARATLERSATGLPAAHAGARQRLAAEDWARKAEDFEALVFAGERSA